MIVGKTTAVTVIVPPAAPLVPDAKARQEAKERLETLLALLQTVPTTSDGSTPAEWLTGVQDAYRRLHEWASVYGRLGMWCPMKLEYNDQGKQLSRFINGPFLYDDLVSKNYSLPTPLLYNWEDEPQSCFQIACDLNLFRQ